MSTGAAGNCLVYFYDGLHRLTDIGGNTQSATNPCRRFRYDDSSGYAGSTKPSGLTNYWGRLVEAATDTCIADNNDILLTDEWFSYDADGRTLDYYQSSPDSAGYYHASYGPNYWANGAVAELNLYDGSNPAAALIPTQTYGVDGEGRTNVVDASSGLNPVSSVYYVNANGVGEPVGALTNVTFGSGDSDQFAYQTTTGRMSQYSFNVNGQSALGNLNWNLNGTLQQLAITDPFNSADIQTCTYSHDALSRITGNNCTGNSAFAQTFGYDAFGNISKSGTIAWACSSCYNGNNQYNSSVGAVSYDANGDLLADTFNTYTWDVYGGLASVNGATVTDDAFGRMVENQSRGLEVVYSSASGPVLAVATGATLNTAYVPLPGGITAAYASGGAFEFLDPDWLGSVRLLTHTGRTASPMVAYAPFGEGYAGGTPGNYEYTAGGYAFTVLDSEGDSGTLADFMFRRYSPTQGRWISPDPAGLGAVDPSNPQSWNRYAYALNNPLALVDPLGLDDCDTPGDCDSTPSDPTSGGEPVNPNANDFNNLVPDVTIKVSNNGDGGLFTWCYECPGQLSAYQTNEPLFMAQGNYEAIVTQTQMAMIWNTASNFPGSAMSNGDVMAGSLAQQVFQGNRQIWRAANQITDPRTIAAWYAASLIVGTTGAVAADLAQGPADSILFGTRFQGNAALLNSSDYLRIGYSQVGENEFVFRVAGDALEDLGLENPHINLWPPSWWF